MQTEIVKFVIFALLRGKWREWAVEVINKQIVFLFCRRGMF